MAKKKQTIWEDAPAKDDLSSASNYLSMVLEDKTVKNLVERFQRNTTVTREAKDVLRASDLPLLEKSDPHVAADLKRIDKKKKLSPVLLIRGDAGKGVPMIIADGYHRICASYYWDETCPIACRIVSLRG